MMARLIWLMLALPWVLPSSLGAAQNAGSVKPRFEVLLARAQDGDAAAQYELGKAYENGVIVKTDDAAALHWLMKAADQKNMSALKELGRSYEYGLFVAKDAARAAEFYVRAAGLGDKEAEVDLTHLYTEGGEGLAPDFDKAAYWAHCPAPASMAMKACQAISLTDLPRGAAELRRRMGCDATTYDYGAELQLRDGSDEPHYQICCHDAAHGPCSAVVIGQMAGRWTDLTKQVGVEGFDERCGGLMILKSTHAGLHDLCLPDRCASSSGAGKCDPMVLEFSGTAYRPAASNVQKKTD